MKVVQPITINDSTLTASNLPEADHAEWNSATDYAVGQRVMMVSTHSVYEAVAISTDRTPGLPANIFSDQNTGGVWLRVGATNRWKAFDQRITDQVTNSETISYTLVTPKLSDGLALFNLKAVSVEVVVRDLSNSIVYEETQDIVDSSSIIDWFTFFTWDGEFQTEALFTGFPAYAGHTVQITISNGPGAVAAVGQVVLGRLRDLGETLGGTEIGIRDFSTKGRDTFGNVTLVQRAFAQTVNFQFSMPVKDERRVQRIVSELRGIPAVYFASLETLDRGTLIYGFYPDFSIPLSSAGVSFATLEIEGLI